MTVSAEDSKGKALSEVDASLRSSQSRSDRHVLPSRCSERQAKRSQSRLNEYTLPNRRYKPQRLYAVWIASGEKKFRLFLFLFLNYA